MFLTLQKWFLWLKRKKNRVYNKHLDSEVTGLLSQIPQFLRPTKKPLSQEATDCRTLLSIITESRASSPSLFQVMERTFEHLNHQSNDYLQPTPHPHPLSCPAQQAIMPLDSSHTKPYLEGGDSVFKLGKTAPDTP